ncbi:MAG: hypothetical protein U1E17_25215 [Geminicoccaceae bacterium]
MDPDLLRRLGDLLLEAGAVVRALADQAEPPIASEAAFDVWYARRAAQLEHSSEMDDRMAALAAGFSMSRQAVREARERLAPERWKRPGRRPVVMAISRQRRI